MYFKLGVSTVEHECVNTSSAVSTFNTWRVNTSSSVSKPGPNGDLNQPKAYMYFDLYLPRLRTITLGVRYTDGGHQTHKIHCVSGLISDTLDTQTISTSLVTVGYIGYTCVSG